MLTTAQMSEESNITRNLLYLQETGKQLSADHEFLIRILRNPSLSAEENHRLGDLRQQFGLNTWPTKIFHCPIRSCEAIIKNRGDVVKHLKAIGRDPPDREVFDNLLPDQKLHHELWVRYTAPEMRCNSCYERIAPLPALAKHEAHYHSK